jgi:hypothetical protein
MPRAASKSCGQNDNISNSSIRVCRHIANMVLQALIGLNTQRGLIMLDEIKAPRLNT